MRPWPEGPCLRQHVALQPPPSPVCPYSPDLQAVPGSGVLSAVTAQPSVVLGGGGAGPALTIQPELTPHGEGLRVGGRLL